VLDGVPDCKSLFSCSACVLDLQVKRSKYPDSGEEDEGMHGTRAAAGSSPGQALTPGPDRMLSQDEEEDCMLEEDDCKEKYLAASRESEGMLNEEGTNVEDDDVQFMGETGPGVEPLAAPVTTNGICSQQAMSPTCSHTCPQRCSAFIC